MVYLYWYLLIFTYTFDFFQGITFYLVAIDYIKLLDACEEGVEGQLAACLVVLVYLVYFVVELGVASLRQGLNLSCIWPVKHIFWFLAWMIETWLMYWVEDANELESIKEVWEGLGQYSWQYHKIIVVDHGHHSFHIIKLTFA